MKNFLQYGLIIFWCSFMAGSCNKRKSLDTRMSLWRLDKRPYGTQFAYDNLSTLFPEAVIRTSSSFPILFRSEDAKDTLRTLIIVSPVFIPETDEMNSLIRFASSGNQVFISAIYIDDTLLSMLHVEPQHKDSSLSDDFAADSSKENRNRKKTAGATKGNVDTGDRAEISLLDPVRMKWTKYVYPGIFSKNHFESIDTSYARILGRNEDGMANFIRISYAHNGAIYIHLEPRAFSNFFLLHNENKSYYDQAFSWLPEKTGVVEWSDYFRYRHQGENYSALHFILTNRSLRWVFWLTLILFLLIFLVESKRKQRAIVEIPKLRNASEDFVKTVGRLYYQQKNNQNLAGKMINAFLENIRSAYNLPTSVLDDEFSRKLAFRTGRHLDEIADLMKSIHHARLNEGLTDKEIMELHQKINQFNKPAL